MEIDSKLIVENSKNLTLLYVEDDEILRVTVMRLLSNFFDKIDIAVDGRDGYEKYIAHQDKHNTPYDIVISDVNMPNMNGLEMSEKIKSLHIEQIIIIITAFSDNRYLRDAIKIGVSGFLSKPVDLDELKKVLYTTTQTIADRKLVNLHYTQIEDKNMLNIDQVDASQFESSKDILNDLVTNREKITKLWVTNVDTQEKLEKYTIDGEYFRHHYAIKVLDYFLDVIKGKEKVGNCPVIITMLKFFKHKNLQLEDIFILCVHFKNAITSYTFSRYSFNRKLFDDFSMILDKNFEGVIVNYLALKGWSKNQKTQPIVAQEEEKKVKIEETNYVEYVLENDIYELQDLEEEIDSLAILVTNINNSTSDDCKILGERIVKYGNILNNYPLFSNLGLCIIKLGQNLSSNAELLFNDKKKMIDITALIEAFVNDLIVWRKEIFEHNISNPYFLDKSFYSNVDTIIMLIEYDETTKVDDDFEDMFF